MLELTVNIFTEFTKFNLISINVYPSHVKELDKYVSLMDDKYLHLHSVLFFVWLIYVSLQVRNKPSVKYFDVNNTIQLWFAPHK